MTNSYSVLKNALLHFSNDDGWAIASHVAMSVLMALFPFVIFGAALASFLGAKEYAETVSHLIFDTWPEVIAEPISQEVVQVLTVDRGGLLTLSALAAAFFSTNGVEALRLSLNRAYRVVDQRSWFVTRLQSLGFVIWQCLPVWWLAFWCYWVQLWSGWHGNISRCLRPLFLRSTVGASWSQSWFW